MFFITGFYFVLFSACYVEGCYAQDVLGVNGFAGIVSFEHQTHREPTGKFWVQGFSRKPTNEKLSVARVPVWTHG